MREYAKIKRGFEFLINIYGFEINFKQKHGSYYFINYTNLKKDIMVLYDVTCEKPIKIRIYDAGSFGFDATEYVNEFDQSIGTSKERIYRAAEWLRGSIENGIIDIF